ncbi:MAG: hypothetical protein HUK00_04445 [Bacteroidaceae bacterium]|nr:hypothetical protein [Bacteroidaceae bacterium]
MSNKHSLAKGAIAAICVVTLASCVNNDYDLSKDVDLNVKVGGELGIPIGTTEGFDFDDLLKLSKTENIKKVTADDEAEMLLYGLNRGDYYFYHQSQDNNENRFKVNEVSVNASQQKSYSSKLMSYVTVGAESETVNIEDVKMSFPVNSNSVTSQVLDLKRAIADIELAIDINYKEAGSSQAKDLPSQATFKNVTLTLSENVVVGENKYFRQGDKPNIAVLRSDAPGQCIVKRGETMATTLLIKAITIPAGCFTPGTNNDGQLSLNFDAVLNGGLTVYGKDCAAGVTSFDLCIEAATYKNPTPINVTEMEGVFAPASLHETKEFRVGEMPEIIANKENKLLVWQPLLEFSVEEDKQYHLDIQFNRIEFTSVYDDTTIPTEKKSLEDVKFGVTEKDGIRWNTAIISDRKTNDDPVRAPGNWIKDRQNLPALIAKGVPNTIKVDIKGAHVTGVLRLGNEYRMRYRLIIPLQFANGAKVVYDGNMTGWHKDLRDMKDISGIVQLRADVKSSMPNDLKLDQLVLLDADGKELTALNIDASDYINTIIESGETTPFAVNINVREADAIQRLDGMKLHLVADVDNDKHITFNETQELEFQNIRLKLTDGISIDLNNK